MGALATSSGTYMNIATQPACRGNDDMDTPDKSAHSQHYRATGDHMAVRDPDEVEGDEDVFEVRMPIASTGEVRNEGDDPLTRDELAGMARQLSEREIGVFPSHGSDDLVTGGRYSQLEKLGVWTDATVEERDGADLLVATARMPDPETLPPATGEFRQALAILKEQATREIPMDASIGWRDDDDAPGGNDLMEASIVGIGADPRTNTGDESAAVVARAAVDAGADPNALVSVVREAVSDADGDTNTHDTMTDDDPGDADAGTTDGEQDADDTDTERVSEDEYRERMLDLQTQQMEVLSSLAERENDDEDDDEEDEDDDEEEQSADTDADAGGDGDDPDPNPDGEQDADADDADTRDPGAIAEEIDSLRDELDKIRSGEVGVDTSAGESADADADADSGDESEERDADADDADTDTDENRATNNDAGSPTDGLGNYR